MTQRKIALSIEEAADYTGIGRNTLRQLVEWKKLPVLKVGRKGTTLIGSPLHLKRLLMNIWSNAIKYKLQRNKFF